MNVKLTTDSLKKIININADKFNENLSRALPGKDLEDFENKIKTTKIPQIYPDDIEPNISIDNSYQDIDSSISIDNIPKAQNDKDQEVVKVTKGMINRLCKVFKKLRPTFRNNSKKTEKINRSNSNGGGRIK